MMTPIEAMARAMYETRGWETDPWDSGTLNAEFREGWRELALAALRALRENVSEEMVKASCATMSHYIRSLPAEQLAGAKMKHGGYRIAPRVKHRERLISALRAAEEEETGRE